MEVRIMAKIRRIKHLQSKSSKHMVTAPLQRPVMFEAIRISFGFAFGSFIIRAFNPFEKYARQTGSNFPKFQGWKYNNIWNRQLVFHQIMFGDVGIHCDF